MKLDTETEKIGRDCLDFLANRTGLGIIVVVCLSCHEVMSIQNGDGVGGLSSAYCPECFKKIMKLNKGNF